MTPGGANGAGRCKHPNCELTELGTSHTTHWFENGALAYHNSDMDDYSGAIIVKCLDCGYSANFRDTEKAPKWVRRLMDMVTEAK